MRLTLQHLNNEMKILNLSSEDKWQRFDLWVLFFHEFMVQKLLACCLLGGFTLFLANDFLFFFPAQFLFILIFVLLGIIFLVWLPDLFLLNLSQSWSDLSFVIYKGINTVRNLNLQIVFEICRVKSTQYTDKLRFLTISIWKFSYR